jgi:hypothetical protein
MITGEGTAMIGRPAQEILDFVMDLEGYKVVDSKIGTIKTLERTGDVAIVKFRAKLRGLPSPFLVTQKVAMTRGERIEVSDVPSWLDRMVHFEGLFQVESTPEGTRVLRRIRFTFAKPMAWVFEPFLRSWLAADVPAEVLALKAHLEARPPTSTSTSPSPRPASA